MDYRNVLILYSNESLVNDIKKRDSFVYLNVVLKLWMKKNEMNNIIIFMETMNFYSYCYLYNMIFIGKNRSHHFGNNK